MYIYFIIFSLLFIDLSSAKNQIKIGGLFHEINEETEIAFRAAMHTFNIMQKEIELVPIVQYVPRDNGFHTKKTVCDMVSNGIAGLFGPFSERTVGVVESIAHQLKIPHFIAQWTAEPLETRKKDKNMTINMYPDSNILARALSELIVDNDWTGYTIVYEDDDGLMRLKKVLQVHDPEDQPITVRQLPNEKDYRPLLKEIKIGFGDILVDCHLENTLDFLSQAKELDMLGEYQRYLFTSLDAHAAYFDNVKLGKTNITTLRLGDTKSFEFQRAVNEWKQYQEMHNMDHQDYVKPETAKLEAALIYDAVKLYANVLRELNEDNEINVPTFDCSEIEQWKFSSKIMKRIKLKSKTGITGPIVIDSEGNRKHFELDIIELSDDGFHKIGVWSPTDGIKYIRSSSEITSKVLENLSTKVVRVVSKYGVPFLMLRTPPEGTYYEGNARFEGYHIDLIDEISKQLNFTYEIEIVPDGKYGNYDYEKKEWNGIVRHIMERKADLGLCDLTITYDRRTAVDFTMPFMSLGISILYIKPTPNPPNLFSFLSPFALDVWLYLATAYLLVSLLMLFLSRITSNEWESAHPCNKEEHELENIWDIKNSSWITIGSIMAQGSDLLPKGIATRLVIGFYWFFALIITASYTANMAAFLTFESMDKSIENVEDLAKGTKIKYGAVIGGSTAAFFRDSNNSLYKKMWTVMEQTKPSVFTTTNEEGIERVAKGKKTYAFFIESTGLEYTVERNCNLTRIGQNLDSKGYGIALPMHSQLRKPLNNAILKLQEHGRLDVIKKKWWIPPKDQQCDRSEKKNDDTSDLGIENVGGVFVILFIGCVTGLLIGVMEFLWNLRHISVEERISFSAAFKRELKFALKVSETTKAVPKRYSSSPESGSHANSDSRHSSVARRTLRGAS